MALFDFHFLSGTKTNFKMINVSFFNRKLSHNCRKMQLRSFDNFSFIIKDHLDVSTNYSIWIIERKNLISSFLTFSETELFAQ